MTRTVRWVPLVVALGLPASATAQIVTVTPGDEYKASALRRFFLGNGWRDVWTTPIQVPVLDLGSFAGGLKPEKAGGNQSRTLHFAGGDGRAYIFRSTHKFIQRALDPDLRDTWAGGIIQDQTSSMHPTGHRVLAPVQDSVGVLHGVPTLVMLPDDERLGEFRKDYAGLLGTIEEKPQEGKDETPGFAGSRKIIGSDKMLERLDESVKTQLDAREFLVARLIDFLTGDTDRGADQWSWARFEENGRDIWRPIQRDKDYAFMRANGVVATAVSFGFPKLVNYRHEFPWLKSLTFMTREFDRSHLVELPWPVWDSVVTRLQKSLTDETIALSVRRLPPELQPKSTLIAEGLRTLRDQLPEVARDFYDMVAEEADVFAGDEDEVADIRRNADGSVDVRLFRRKDLQDDGARAAPGFQRRFVPAETKEVRIYMQRGNDRAVVHGAPNGSIKIRVTGGDGDDFLADSANAPGRNRTIFYDAHGNNTMMGGSSTRIDRQPYDLPQPRKSYDGDDEEKPGERTVFEERRGRFQDLMNNTAAKGFIDQKTSASAFARTWGSDEDWLPAVDFREGAGLVLGVTRRVTNFGFRHAPYDWQIALTGLYALGSSGFGAQAHFIKYPENSTRGASLLVRATQFEASRFYGFGNDTELLDRELALVMRDELLVQPTLRWSVDKRHVISAGPLLRYIKPRPEEGSPAALNPATSSRYGQVGARVEAMVDARDHAAVPRRGVSLSGGASFYPAVWDVTEAFGEVHGEAALHIPLGRPTIALHGGAKRVWGDFPLHEAAFLGGKRTVRGYRHNRFAGDLAAFGSGELRVPITRIKLLSAGDLGVFGFGDAGRVWIDNVSAGDLRTGYGAGVWFATLGKALSVSYARGEEPRLYFQLGLPY